jgi:uncharacterized protein YcnI
MRSGRRTVVVGALVLGIAVLGIGLAADASAHVTVSAPGATVGASDATITFRVPDESDTASTVGLKVELPVDHPIAGVLVAPQQGWTAKITQTTLRSPIHTDDGDITQVVSEIDWAAQRGSGIKPGFFGQFTIIGGQLPDGVSTLVFKAIQTYSDGKQVDWIEQPAPGSTAEPEHPAPTLHLAAGGSSTGAAEAVSGSQPAVTATAKRGVSTAAATTGIVLGAVGVLLGAAALALVLVRGRRSAGAAG